MSWNSDLTLDEALADPMIAAALRADRVDPRHFEALLRGTARRIAPPTALARTGRAGRADRTDRTDREAPPHSFAAGDQLRSCRRPAAEGCSAW